MQKREYKVINIPLALRHRVAKPGALFAADEVIGGGGEIDELLKGKRIEKIASDESESEKESLGKSDEKKTSELEVENEKLKAENEKLASVIDKSSDKKKIKASFEEYEKIISGLEEENAKLKSELESKDGAQ